jgi:formylglycine-generating enzyme required for sulfatase activity
MASNDAQGYNIAAIRQLLLAAFTPEELRRFCYDRPDFRPVVDLFGPGLGFSAMVDQVVEYCDRRVLLDELLAEVKQTNPRQYARFEATLLVTRLEKPPAETVIKPTTDKPSIARPPAKAIEAPRRDGPAQAMPEVLTITKPIHLELVVVPAGEFLMGSVVATDKDAQDNELPRHTIRVPEFAIGKYPVTNSQYWFFAQATGHPAPRHWQGDTPPRQKSNHPVVTLSWKDAVAFCDWLSRETKEPYRLPTEAEWEKAARGTDGRIYPWGDEPPDEKKCNFNSNIRKTTPVDRYSPTGDSPYGCADMAGNVYEWCHSLHKPYPYRAGDGREDLKAGGFRVLRGGSGWTSAQLVRCASRVRDFPDGWTYPVGFRIARGPLP